MGINSKNLASKKGPMMMWGPFDGGYDQFEEKGGRGLRSTLHFSGAYSSRNQFRTRTHLRHSFASLSRLLIDFNIILTIGTTRRSRGVEWGIVTLPYKACHRPTKDILFREYSRHSGSLRSPPILEYPGKLLVITFASLIPLLVIPT